MAKIEFLPSGKTVEAQPGTELLDAARRAGVDIEAPCGGDGKCGECLARVMSGEVDTDSLGVLGERTVADGYVLACQTRLRDGPATVEVLEQPAPSSQRDTQPFAGGELSLQELELDPLVRKRLIRVSPPRPEDGLSDLDRLFRGLRSEGGEREVTCPLRAVRCLPDVVRAEEGRVTVTLADDGTTLNVVDIGPGDRTARHYGIAVDVGTTTVEVQLVDLTGPRILALRSGYNDQVMCGADVISRINYARRPERLEELRARVLKTTNRLLEQVTHQSEVGAREITSGVVSGNTTMIHLLLGVPPEHIRLHPYTPTLLETPFLRAGDVGLAIHPDALVWFSPASGSYVGGDITAGLLCTDMVTGAEEISLFIDIGTNGELVIGNNEFLIGCACSAGPAFEGGCVECGMRAARGAIEKVAVDRVTGATCYETIGGSRPHGICGSGMIDLVANLFLAGWIDPAGKFDRSRSSPHLHVDGKTARYVIATGDESTTGRAITVSETDIENIVRAKAAIYSACSLLLAEVGLAFGDLSRIYVAGAFGRFLPLEKAVVMGLAPDVPRERFRFIGNASLTGSCMVLVSRDQRERQLESARRMTYIDLSNRAGYMNEYTGATFLPHTDAERFPSVKEQLQTLKELNGKP